MDDHRGMGQQGRRRSAHSSRLPHPPGGRHPAAPRGLYPAGVRAAAAAEDHGGPGQGAPAETHHSARSQEAAAQDRVPRRLGAVAQPRQRPHG